MSVMTMAKQTPSRSWPLPKDTLQTPRPLMRLAFLLPPFLPPPFATPLHPRSLARELGDSFFLLFRPSWRICILVRAGVLTAFTLAKRGEPSSLFCRRFSLLTLVASPVVG